MRRRDDKSAVKGTGYTRALPWILETRMSDGAGGTCEVAVKCVDMTWNADREAGSRDRA